jgi:hypothetical protein
MATTTGDIIKSMGMSRPELARLLGVSHPTLNQWASRGSIPPKFWFALMGDKPLTPELRKIFGFVELGE